MSKIYITKIKRKPGIVIILLCVAVLVISGCLAIWLAEDPPYSELKLAREALSLARKAEAEKYASSYFIEAQQLYDSAIISWSVQNDRFMVFREYNKVRSFAVLAAGKAAEAEEYSVSRYKNKGNLVQNGIVDLESKVKLYEERYKRMALPAGIINGHNRGKMKLEEARLALAGNRYNEAELHYNEAFVLVNESNDMAEEILAGWFSDFPKWKKQGQEAVQMSRGGQKVIVIDKYAHKCMVYQSGKVIRQFDIELGLNWIGDKRKKGDKATPEGIYRITKKKDNGQTKFHLALLINYPNAEDSKNFASEKKNGTLASHVNIGGLIEIHGMGGKGIDWTDGCMALRNEDMESLFSLVSVGTPVIIVGSLEHIR